jgi:hypothetical protein
MKYTNEEKREIVKKVSKMLKKSDYKSIMEMPKDIFEDSDIMRELLYKYPYAIIYESPTSEYYIDDVRNAIFQLFLDGNVHDYWSCRALLAHMPEFVRDDDYIMSTILRFELYKTDKKSYDKIIGVLKDISDKAMTDKLLSFLYINSYIDDQDIELAFKNREVFKRFESIREKLHEIRIEYKNYDYFQIDFESAYSIAKGDTTLLEAIQRETFARLINLSYSILDNKNKEYIHDIVNRYLLSFEFSEDKNKIIIDFAKKMIINSDEKYTYRIINNVNCFINKELILEALPKMNYENIYHILTNSKIDISLDKNIIEILLDKTNANYDNERTFLLLKNNSSLEKEYVLNLFNKMDKMAISHLYNDLPENLKEDKDILEIALPVIELQNEPEEIWSFSSYE